MADILAVAAQRADWLAQRQSVLARNVANVSTPGYRAEDTRAFADAADAFALTLRATQAGHMTNGASPAGAAARTSASQTWDTSVSGNSVNIEEELVKTNEVNRAMALNAAVTRGFHRMIIANVKG